MRLKKIIICLVATLSCWHLPANAVGLVEVYQQALISDPTYQQAINQQLSTSEGVPISISQLLPNISLNFNPSITRQAFAGAQLDNSALSPRNNTQKAFALTLSLSQTIFDFSQFMNVESALATSKSACATLNAALQDLMVRTETAYFAVLQAEENLIYTEASKMAYAEQLDQAKQQFNVGIKTITDVYTAQASYDSAVALFVAAEATLANNRENLRVITGKYYPHLSKLRNDFPLLTPKPASVETWVQKAQMQNWTIKASQYTAESALATVKQQYSGHLPTVTLEGTLDRQYTLNMNSLPDTIDQREGASTQTDRGVTLNMTLPIFQGGGVVAATKQAVYNYKLAQQQLEQTMRDTVNTTRQSYRNILSGVSQLKADKEAVKSNISSLEGMETSYRVGTETLVNVLNQKQKLFQAQIQYSRDRYSFVNNLFALKQAAGTLSFNDLHAINAWLTDKNILAKPHYIKRETMRESRVTKKQKTVAVKAHKAKKHVTVAKIGKRKTVKH